MKFAKHVSNFEVDKASYFMHDVKGNKILLKVNYLGNSYELESINPPKTGYNELAKEAKRVCQDLLSRKAQRNLTLR